MYRRLVRPAVAVTELSHTTEQAPPPKRKPMGQTRLARSLVPPSATRAEAYYYLKQMNTDTPMVFHLDNKQTVTGVIEWYDRDCLKIQREDGPNVLLYKKSIRFMYKLEDET